MGECSQCGGSGKVTCDNCNGSGRVIIVNFGSEDTFAGTKIFSRDPFECQDCDGAGNVDCPSCGGTGDDD